MTINPGRSVHVRPPGLTGHSETTVPMTGAEFLNEAWIGREVRCNWRARDDAERFDDAAGQLKRRVSRTSEKAVYFSSNDTESYLPLPTSRNGVRIYRTPDGFLYVDGSIRLRYRWDAKRE